MARVKSKKETTIKSWHEAEKMIAAIGDKQRRIRSIENTANEQIDMLKETMAEETKPLTAEIKDITNDLELFCIMHRDDFGRSQSRKLTLGLVGWRKSTRISVAKTAIEKIKAVYGRASKKYLNVKETVSKEDIKELTDQQLAKINCKRVVSETFFVEPETVEARDEL